MKPIFIARMEAASESSEKIDKHLRNSEPFSWVRKLLCTLTTRTLYTEICPMTELPDGDSCLKSTDQNMYILQAKTT